MSNEFFDIDPDRLDEEWLAQPRRYHEKAVLLANCRRSYEMQKAKRDVVTAEMDRDVRCDPKAFGLDKLTETVIEKTIVLGKGYQMANEKVVLAKHDLDIAQAAVDALDQKKHALQDMVRLRLANYYAEPLIPPEARKVIDAVFSDKAFNRKGKKHAN